MKTLIATALIIASSASYAHDNSFSSESCNVDLNGGININAKEIIFSKNKSPLYTITNNDTLIIKGEEVTLTSHQKSLIRDYSSHIRDVVPEVKSIALDAIDLAIDGVNLAFNELLGEGNNVSADLTTQLTTIRGEVDAEFNKQNSFYIDEDGFSGKDFFGDDFEQRIESAVESTIKNSLGTLMIAVGQEMLFSGGDMDAFETKMDDFGELIGNEMETRSEGIEKRGEALCQSIMVIDEMEEQLKDSIDEISNYNFITASSKSSHNKI
ncbi:DUF2884 family protein [Cognaticolwellia beringensis]|uniref:DUF2884 domain-containing protein n=1 Tax=Cognaticolwellia beringensis TaxID=1967665 RepID=A0A222GAT2_9GAMM|nr:DUF2884 family protein [Cognaticolwellia beringensis]ASP48901.1 DUF2884 domain-containing protein [Cognaticolwellia beringensis]